MKKSELMVLFFTLMSSVVMSGCSRDPVLSINNNSRAMELRSKLEDSKITRVSDLLASDEDFICVMPQLGGVGGKNDKFNKESRLRQLNPPWIADDGYWSIIFFSTKDDRVERIFGVNRARFIDLDLNDKDMCFSSDAIITRSQRSIPEKQNFIKFN